MGIDRKESSVSEAPAFVGVPEDKLLEIAQAVERRVVPAHTIIFRQGDPGDSFYIIISGKVRVFRKGGGGVETEFSRLGPGDSFGELALLTGKPRTTHVETVEETHLLVIRRDQFDRVLTKYSDVSLTFVKELSSWLLQGELTVESGSSPAPSQA